MTSSPPVFASFAILSGTCEALYSLPLLLVKDSMISQLHDNLQMCADSFPQLREWAAEKKAGVVYDRCFNLYRAALRWEADPLVESHISALVTAVQAFDTFVLGDI